MLVAKFCEKLVQGVRPTIKTIELEDITTIQTFLLCCTGTTNGTTIRHGMADHACDNFNARFGYYKHSGAERRRAAYPQCVPRRRGHRKWRTVRIVSGKALTDQSLFPSATIEMKCAKDCNRLRLLRGYCIFKLVSSPSILRGSWTEMTEIWAKCMAW